jgi:hypothetical protein
MPKIHVRTKTLVRWSEPPAPPPPPAPIPEVFVVPRELDSDLYGEFEFPPLAALLDAPLSLR